METAKVTSKGQITLPRNLRKRMNIKKGDIIGFAVNSGKVELMRLGSIEDLYGSIKVEGEQNFPHIREVTLERAAEEAADEGK